MEPAYTFYRYERVDTGANLVTFGPGPGMSADVVRVIVPSSVFRFVDRTRLYTRDELETLGQVASARR